MPKLWDYSFKKGREKRLQAELKARMNRMPFNVDEVPLHSHSGTLQSCFQKGWYSVSEVDIRMYVDGPISYQQSKARLAKLFKEQSK